MRSKATEDHQLDAIRYISALSTTTPFVTRIPSLDVSYDAPGERIYLYFPGGYRLEAGRMYEIILKCSHCGNKWHEDSWGRCESCGAPE